MTSGETIMTLAFITALGNFLVMMPRLLDLELAKGPIDLTFSRMLNLQNQFPTASTS
jgi:hypothetical protein